MKDAMSKTRKLCKILSIVLRDENTWIDDVVSKLEDKGDELEHKVSCLEDKDRILDPEQSDEGYENHSSGESCDIDKLLIDL